MEIEVKRKTPEELRHLHERVRAEANCQMVHDSFWARGLLDVWAIEVEGKVAGHGGVSNRYDNGRVMEFWTLPEVREQAKAMFEKLLEVSEATSIEAQSNMPLMAAMLRKFGEEIRAEKFLFAEGGATELVCPKGGVFRRMREEGELAIFEHRHEPDGDWVIEAGAEIVATGGWLTHYNPPYADLSMEVAESQRRRGFGSFLIQELKKTCYEAGKRPAARCDVANVASRRTLEKGGMALCGEMLVGKVRADCSLRAHDNRAR